MDEALYYLRIVVFPLCSLGLVVSAVYEYQLGKSKLRLAIMLVTAVLMLTWMVLTIAAVENPLLMPDVRSFAVTPLVLTLTILVWAYAILRTKAR